MNEMDKKKIVCQTWHGQWAEYKDEKSLRRMWWCVLLMRMLCMAHQNEFLILIFCCFFFHLIFFLHFVFIYSLHTFSIYSKSLMTLSTRPRLNFSLHSLVPSIRVVDDSDMFNVHIHYYRLRFLLFVSSSFLKVHILQCERTKYKILFPESLINMNHSFSVRFVVWSRSSIDKWIEKVMLQMSNEADAFETKKSECWINKWIKYAVRMKCVYCVYSICRVL